MRFSDYKTVIFDCDGVILHSNMLKTNAFYNSTISYGKSAADAMVAYHLDNGGVSRYKKFSWFLEEVVPDVKGLSLDELLDIYASEVRKELFSCDIAEKLAELRAHSSQASWLVVSGGDQTEIREVFSARGIDHYFNKGIFGSPTPKKDILAHELMSGNILLPALYLGDSRYDYIAAAEAGLDFIFVSGWSDFQGWLSFCKGNSIEYVNAIKDLLEL